MSESKIFITEQLDKLITLLENKQYEFPKSKMVRDYFGFNMSITKLNEFPGNELMMLAGQYMNFGLNFSNLKTKTFKESTVIAINLMGHFKLNVDVLSIMFLNGGNIDLLLPTDVFEFLNNDIKSKGYIWFDNIRQLPDGNTLFDINNDDMTEAENLRNRILFVKYAVVELELFDYELPDSVKFITQNNVKQTGMNTSSMNPNPLIKSGNKRITKTLKLK